MLPHKSFLVHLLFFDEIYVCSYLLLLPKYWHTASHTNVDEEPVMNFDYLLSLDKVGRVPLQIYTSTVEPRPRHVGTSSADIEILPSEVLISHTELSHKSLKDRYGPTIMHLTFKKGLYNFSIPGKLIELILYVIAPPDDIFLHTRSFLSLMADQWCCDDFFVAEVEILVDVGVLEGLHYFSLLLIVQLLLKALLPVG